MSRSCPSKALAALGSARIVSTMSTVQEIEQAVVKLPPHELAAFRNWFLEFDADAWEQQFAADVNAGKLDHLAAHADADFKAGRCTEL
jgi:hypothetical protein